MDHSDVCVFELLAALFTLNFILLTFFLWRFMRAVDASRGRPKGRPGLQRGAVQFRVQGRSAPSNDEALSDPHP